MEPGPLLSSLCRVRSTWTPGTARFYFTSSFPSPKVPFTCDPYVMWRSCSSSDKQFDDTVCRAFLVDFEPPAGTARLMLHVQRQQRVMVESMPAGTRLGKPWAKADSVAYMILLSLLTNSEKSSLDSLNHPHLTPDTTTHKLLLLSVSQFSPL